MPQQETKDLDTQLTQDHGVMEFDEPSDPHFLERLIVLAEHKVLILGVVGVSTLVSLIVCFLLPNTYQANTQIMPPQQNPSAAAAILTQLGSLGAMAGSELGLHNPSDLYVDMLRSRTVADDLIQRFMSTCCAVALWPTISSSASP